MNSKGIGISLVILAALGAATAYVYTRPATETSSRLTDPWQRVERARVDHVTIKRPSGPEAQRTIELERRDGHWVMTSPGRGPTDATAVDDLLTRFADLHVVGVAGRNPSSYDTFEVDDAHATRVTLKAGASTLIDVLVGASLDSGSAVRVPGRQETFRVGQSITSMVQREPRDWRDREITRVSRDAIQSVEWVNRNGTFRFTRNGETWSAAPGITVDRLDTARVNSLVDSVANLRASDFADASAQSGVAQDSPRVTLTASGDGGARTYTVRLGSTSGENEAYVQREGSDTVYVISRTMSESINPAVTAFQAPLPSDGGAAADASAAPEPMVVTPSGPPGAAPQIPPQIMEQLRRQLQQAGGAH